MLTVSDLLALLHFTASVMTHRQVQGFGICGLPTTSDLLFTLQFFLQLDETFRRVWRHGLVTEDT